MRNSSHTWLDDDRPSLTRGQAPRLPSGTCMHLLGALWGEEVAPGLAGDGPRDVGRPHHMGQGRGQRISLLKVTCR